MKSLDFILSSAEVMSAVKELVSTQGITTNGELWSTKNRPSVKQLTSRLEDASEEELFSIIEDAGFSVEDMEVPARVSADEVVIDLSQEEIVTLTAKDGTEHTAVIGVYVEPSANGFKFKLKSGGYIIHTGDKLFQLWNANGLTEGYKMPFKPETIRPSKHIGFYNGVPNFSADERLTKLLGINERNQKKLRAKIADIRALKLPKAIMDARINKLVDEVVEPVKLEKLSF